MSDTASEQALAYVREHYRVPAEAGHHVTVDGNPGTITGGQNAYLLVDFGGFTVPCHPTWRVSYDVSASLPASGGRRGESSRSDHLGACGHELDEWETHLAHVPDCPRELCLDDRCGCPEVCPDCCVACGYDLAERMGS